jgi:iron complex outermembrane receptor protein
MKTIASLLLLLASTFTIQAQQQYLLSGSVTEKGNQAPLPGVNILVEGQGSGTVTDLDGRYRLLLTAGSYQVRFSYVGYTSEVRQLNLQSPQTLNMQLAVAAGQLDQVVVTAGRFEQRLSEVTVSMEVIKPELLQQNNITRFDDALERVPGVSVVNGQLNIRGTSGFSYGAGSRVQVLVDDMPLLSADAGDVKWAYLPIENVSQIEVIKGASSALFGSS